MLTSNALTALGAARYDGAPAPVLDLLGDAARARGLGAVEVRYADGRWARVGHGQVVVLWAPGDPSVMDPGEYERHFGAPIG